MKYLKNSVHSANLHTRQYIPYNTPNHIFTQDSKLVIITRDEHKSYETTFKRKKKTSATVMSISHKTVLAYILKIVTKEKHLK